MRSFHGVSRLKERPLPSTPFTSAFMNGAANLIGTNLATLSQDQRDRVHQAK